MVKYAVYLCCHWDKPYKILRIRQEMLKGKSEDYLNMLAIALKMQIHEHFGILYIA